MTGNNPNLDIVYINTYTKFGEILSIGSLSGNKILISIKGYNSVTNWRKMTGNYPNLDLVNSNAYPPPPHPINGIFQYYNIESLTMFFTIFPLAFILEKFVVIFVGSIACNKTNTGNKLGGD